MPEIRKLSESSINRIAAGEVVEKPSSVVKELCENSIDSGATSISIILEMGGKNLISIIDNGCGMDKEDMYLALQRHTTSKLRDEDLTDIKFFGFRGEALPSISSVSNMSIISRKSNMNKAYKIENSAGQIISEKYIEADFGTKIEVKDLFYITPARLKFLKTDRTEAKACFDIIKRMSLAHPEISFTLISDNKTVFTCKSASSQDERIKDIFKDEFFENSSIVNLNREHYSFKGYTSIPTYNKASSTEQYLFVNNRPVKDKLLNIALKVAYQDYLSRDRHPASVIYIDVNPKYVDVNVHPSKTEIRFREPSEVRGMLIRAIKDALAEKSQNTSTELSQNFVEKISKNNEIAYNTNQNNFHDNRNLVKQNYQSYKSSSLHSYHSAKPSKYSETNLFNHLNVEAKNFETEIEYVDNNTNRDTNNPMGAAVAQVHSTYIISETEDGIIITDQHASHERLIYENLKKDLLQDELPTQRLIIPEIIDLDDEFNADSFMNKLDELRKFGLIFQKFNSTSIIVHEVPAILGEFNVTKLIKDLSHNFRDLGEDFALSDLIEHVTETYACHHSIRSGRKMHISEMNDLLRDMENTPFSGQCNHGRPTYVKLDLKDIERLFGRR